jgi:cytoskeletal protein RodZ
VSEKAITVGAVGCVLRNARHQWRHDVSIGEVLAAARAEAGLTVTDVSDRTRITRTVITAIEGDDYESCGGDFYARGHIRSIAKAVGTDPEPLIREYDDAHPRLQLTEEYLTKPITRAVAGRPPRRPPARFIAAAAGLVVALGLGGYLLASRGHSAGASGVSTHHVGQASHPAPPSPTATPSTHASPTPAPPRFLRPASATAFGMSGSGGDHGEQAHLAIDHNNATAWNTDWYTTARFGNLYPATGLLINMGRPVTISAVQIRLGRTPGASLQLRVGSAPALSSLQTVAHASNVGGLVNLRFTRPAHGRYLLVWFTNLPPNGAGTFGESVYGVQVQGR